MTDLRVRSLDSGLTCHARSDAGNHALRRCPSPAQHASFKEHFRPAIAGGGDRVAADGAQHRPAGEKAWPNEVGAEQQEGRSCKAVRCRDPKVEPKPAGSETNMQLLEVSAPPWSGMAASQLTCHAAQSEMSGRSAQTFQPGAVTDSTTDRAKCDIAIGAHSDDKASMALGSRQVDLAQLRPAATKAQCCNSAVPVTLLRQEAHFLPVRETLQDPASTNLTASAAPSHGTIPFQSIAAFEPKTAQAAQPDSRPFERSMNMKNDDAQSSSLDRKEERRSSSTLLETTTPGLPGDAAARAQSPNVQTPEEQPIDAPNGGARWRQDSQVAASVLRVLDVQLAPTGLGLIGARLSLGDGGLAVRLSAETRSAVDAIESQAASLRGTLADSGYLVADVSVSLEMPPASAGDAASMPGGNSAESLNDPGNTGNGSDKGSRPHRERPGVGNTKTRVDDHVPRRRDGTYV